MAKIVNICDVCSEIFAGGDAPKGNMSETKTEEYNIPIYANGEANEGLYGYTNKARVTKPSITVSARGTIGYTAIRPTPFVPIVRLITLTPNPELIDIKYLYYAAQNYKFDGSGTSIPQLTVPSLKKYSFPLPAMEEQAHIVMILDNVCDLIDQKKQQLELLDELVKSRFIELFGSLNDNEKGLDIVSIEELCTLIKDGTHQTPTYTEDKQNGFKFLSSKDVMTQKICWDDIKYIPAELHEKLYATIQPQRNDILMSKNGVNYGVAAVNDTDEIFDIYVSLALLRPRTDMVNPVYLRCVINNPDTKRQFDSSIKGIGVPNLHLGEIKKTKVLLPPIDKQNEFVAFVEQTEKSKLAVQQSIAELEELKKSLMQKYFG